MNGNFLNAFRSNRIYSLDDYVHLNDLTDQLFHKICNKCLIYKSCSHKCNKFEYHLISIFKDGNMLIRGYDEQHISICRTNTYFYKKEDRLNHAISVYCFPNNEVGCFVGMYVIPDACKLIEAYIKVH